MIYAILSDIHANESAFRHVLADAKAKGAERLVCLGDVVGYGPLPEETANLVRSACTTVIAGNHDDAVTGRLDAKDFINLAGDAVRRHREVLSKKNLEWLGRLDHTYAGDGFIAAHGDFTDPKQFFYINDEDDAMANFQANDAQLMFVGHTHVPQLFLTGESGKVYKMDPTDFALEDGKRYIVNPGSVGYPRENNGVCQSSYVLYDSELREVTFHTLPFAVSSVMQRGQTPRKARKGGLIAAILLLSALIGLAIFLFTPKTVEIKEDTSLIIKREVIPLTSDLKAFLPNLRLQKRSKPVRLQAVFKTADGQIASTFSKDIPQSRTKPIKVPAGATQAEISLLKLNPGDDPLILEYKPAFKP